MSNICDYYVPADHVGDMRLVCHEGGPNRVILQGRIKIIHTRNASELMEYSAQWVSAAPHVILQEVQLVAEKMCSVNLSKLGDSKCMLSEADSEAGNVLVVPIVLGIIITVLLVAVTIMATCGILVLRKKKM